MNASAIGLELQAMKIELAALKDAARLQSKLAFSVAEAAVILNVGRTELYARIAAPDHSSLHIRALHIGRKLSIPRSECERLLREQAR